MQPSLNLLPTIQQAITNLLTVYEPEFLRFGYTLFLTDVVAVRGIVRAAGFPLLILLMEVLQLCYARWMARNGLLR